jgi:hypothetical protein
VASLQTLAAEGGCAPGGALIAVFRITGAVVLFAYPALAQDFEPGSKIDDFTTQDLSGKPQNFTSP